MTPRWISCLLLIAGLVRGGGRRVQADEAPEPPPRVMTWEGDLIVGELTLGEVEVETEYGLLRVPMGEIWRIEFAPGLADGESERVEILTDELLRAEDTDRRRQIGARIESHGVGALEHLRWKRAEASEEVREVLDPLMDRLEDELGERDLHLDRVVTRRFTIVGRARIPSLAVKSRYGQLLLDRSEVDRLILGDGPGREKTDRVLFFKTWTDTDGEYLQVFNAVRARTKLKPVEFTGNSAPALTRLLARHRVLVIPELEQGRQQVAPFATQASRALRKFVKTGGVVISCGGIANIAFLSSSGLLPCQGRSRDSEVVLKRKHPILRGLPPNLPRVNATFPITPRAPGTVLQLGLGTSGGVVVGVARLGDGAVVYCGWDFFKSLEPHQRLIANAALWGAGHLGPLWPR